MINHVTLAISDFAVNKSNYEKVLVACGYRKLVDEESYAGFGAERPQFWISAPHEGKEPSARAHVAITVDSKEKVHVFYEMAIALGWKDNGAPGPRPEYTETYYGAFVIDQDGNNLEAVAFN